MGVIETLSTGFSTVTRRPWLILIPVIFDLLLWLGPRIDAAPLINRGLARYDEVYSSTISQLGSNYLTEQDMGESYKQLRMFGEQLGKFNLVGFAVTPLVIEALDSPLPSLINIISVPSTAEIPQRLGFSVGSGGLLAILWMGLVAFGALVSALYLGPIAWTVQQQKLQGTGLLQWLGTYWGRLILFFVFIMGLLVFVVMPGLIILGLISLWIPALGSLLLALAGMLALWVMLHLFFVNSAIFVDNFGVLGAIASSFITVRTNFWPSLALIVLVLIIQWGTVATWGFIIGHPIGILVAILGNAYIATGLATATFLFYRERSITAKKQPSTISRGV